MGPGGPGGPWGAPPGGPGGPPPPKKSKAPLVVAGVVVVLLLVAAAVVGIVVLSGGSTDAGSALHDEADRASSAQEQRVALAAAVRDGDAEALEGAVEAARGQVADEAEPAVLGEAAPLPLNDAGYAVVAVEGEPDRSYTVSASLVDGDGTLSSAVVPPEGPPSAPADIVDATVAGTHHVVVAAPEGTEGEVEVRVQEIEVISVELEEDAAIDGELAQPGDAIEYELAGEATQHYLVYLDSETDLTTSVIGPDRQDVATTTDPIDEVPRFVAETSGSYRIRVSGGMSGTTGAFTIEVVRVAEYYFFYGDDPDSPTYIGRTQEQIQPPVGDDNRAHFCFFVREGISLEVTAQPTDPGLDMGMDVFDQTDEPPLRGRANANGPGQPEVWGVDADTDQWWCIQLWGVDFTGGTFRVSFTTG